MNACSKPRTRGAGAWSAPFLVAGLIAPALVAAAEPAPAGGAPGVAAMASVIAKDPETGQLRPATEEEMQALRQSRVSLRSAAPTSPQPRSHWSGAQGARLTDEFASYSVVVKRADGKLVELCVQGAEAAARVQQTVGVGKPALPTE